jgi:putative nucleotidyltransferase with HDIG domain
MTNTELKVDLRNIIDHLQDIICSFLPDPIPTLVYTNFAISEYTFYDPKEFYQDPSLFFQIIHPDDLEMVKQYFAGDAPREASFRILRRNGVVLPVHARFSNLYNKGTTLTSIQLVMRVLVDTSLPTNIKADQFESDQRIKRYIEELSIIADIGRTLGENLNIEEIYHRLGVSVKRMFPDSPIFFVSRYLPEIKKISCMYGLVEDEELDITQIPLADLDYSEQGTQTKVILEGKPLIIPDLVAHRGGPQNIGTLVGSEGEFQIPRSSMLVPMMVKNQVLGVVQVQSASVNRFSEDDVRLLAVVANTAASVIQSAYTLNLLVEAYDKTIEGWGQAVELRDRETSGHSLRVAALTVEVARRLGMIGEEIVNIRRGALMHDIGKLGVPDSILLKNGPLDLDEIVEMHKHPQYAYDMLKNITFMKDALEIPYYHHEKWDGTGYPHRLKGKDIPLSARIFAVIDVYDALLSDRPYRRAWTNKQVMDYIEMNSGSFFDPEICKIFLQMINEKDNSLLTA